MPSYLVCDTGPEVIYVWSEVKYGQVAPSVREALRQVKYDLTLLCAPDLPWTYDPQREHPEASDRWKIFERYRILLPDARIIRGQERTATALRLITTS